MKTCILYIRVSTDEQAEKGYSQRYQLETLQRFCLINSIEIQQIIFEDHSAKTFNRPGWKRVFAIFQRKSRPDMLLFTKWDRFSRNTTDAYQMIRTLNDYGVELQATEQPLNLEIPENKMMLAIYLAAPEVENDRRAMNVSHGMRRAKKEGRWMGGAPIGYVNKTSESGDKYICPREPQASHMKWALEQLANGIYNTSQIWNAARKNGLVCSKSNFYEMIVNPVYCGKIIVPAYKNEPMYCVDGKHEGIVTEKIFRQVQIVINNKRNKRIEIKTETPPELYLRGFLACLKCNRMLTGSRSTGRHDVYYYYHCQSSCGFRYRASLANAFFENEIARWKIKKGFSNLYKVIREAHGRQAENLEQNDYDLSLKKIRQQNIKLKRARDLFIDGDMDASDFRQVKIDCTSQVKHLQELMRSSPVKSMNENASVTYEQDSNIRLIDLFKIADISQKRSLISLMFPEKLIFNKTTFEIKQYGLAAQMIFKK